MLASALTLTFLGFAVRLIVMIRGTVEEFVCPLNHGTGDVESGWSDQEPNCGVFLSV